MLLILINVIISKLPNQYRKINDMLFFSIMANFLKIMKRILQDYDIRTQFAAVNILRNSLVHSKGKQQQNRLSDVVYEICCNPNFACQDAYIGETSQLLQHRLKQHYQSSYNGNDENDSAVFKHIIASEHQIDVIDVTILDREENWCERDVNEAVWVRTKKSLIKLRYKNYAFTFLGSLHKHSTQLFSISDMFRK